MERAKRRRLFVRAATLLASAVVAWAVLWSPLLEVRDVRVVGARHTTPFQVSSAAGLDSSDNVLLLSTDAVARRIEALAWVKRAQVERKLPGTIRVRIRERRPAVLVSGERGVWTLDYSGVVLAEEGGHDVPVLRATDAGALSPGERVHAPEIRAALRALRSLPAELRRRVEGAFAPSPHRIAFSLSGGPLVRYGSADALREKRTVLTALLDRLDESDRSVGYIDVRVPQSPAVSATPPRRDG